jgi:hypothetical protein
MATTTQKKRNIKYLNRDFESFKRDFIEHLRVYFPDTVQDFNESSVGMMLTELAAFVGDNLSFYVDKRVNESFTETSREEKNILKHAKQLGFKPFGKSSATGTVDAYLKVPAIASNQKIQPDMRYAGTIKRGAKLKSKNGQTYETLEDVDFSKVNINDSRYVVVGDRDPTTRVPTTFILKKVGVEIKAGETTSTTFSIGAYKAFRKVILPDEDVLEILRCTDSENNQWYEVDFLPQDTVFDGVINTSADSTDVPYVLKLRSVPYRFVSEYDVVSKKTAMVFGTGDAQNFDGDLIPDLGDLSLPLYGKDTFTDFSIDPQNFLKTRTMGLAPVNTTLTVQYRIGGGADTNAGAGEIDTVVDSVFDVGDSSLNSAVVTDVANSFSVLNPNPIQGGRDELSVDEIKQLIPAVFASQSRLVTAPDFVARALSMPSRFGSVFRANAKLNPFNKNSVELIVLSKNSSGFVTTAPNDLKTNLKTYLSRFRMITDAIEILDGEVINIALNFSILVKPDFNKTEVLVNCIDALKEYFEIDRWQLNQPINLTDIYTTIAAVPGVLSVVDVTISNRVATFDGRSYSNTPHNITENKKNGIIYSKENAIFELKFPNKDIVGVAK